MCALRRKEDYYTPSELIEKYPQVLNADWTAVKIGMLYNMGLLLGYYSGAEKRNLIEEQSFLELIDYFNDLNGRDSHRFVKRIDR